MAVSENRSISAIGPTMPILRKNQYVKLELVKPFWVLHSTLLYMSFAAHLQFVRKRALVGGISLVGGVSNPDLRIHADPLLRRRGTPNGVHTVDFALCKRALVGRVFNPEYQFLTTSDRHI